MSARYGRLAAPGFAALAVLFLPYALNAHHAVLRFNLEEMTATADRIFVGRCLAVAEAEEMIAQGMMPVTRYTFEVERAVKGKLPRRITFRQLGHPAHRALGKGGEMTMHGDAVTSSTFIHGMSVYGVGDRLLLFLIPDYLGGKVTYPVGLYQGAFFVSRMPSGRDLARNSINNLGLFTAPYNGTAMSASAAKSIFPEQDNPVILRGSLSGNQSLASKRGALPLDSLLELVDQINLIHGGERGAIVLSGKGGALQ
ncbi:MAG TPA: hypothetical protein VNO24_24050 [Blastocatellia bacterium]|nr:hypothetical protein [Blastocatellia bacterium]